MIELISIIKKSDFQTDFFRWEIAFFYAKKTDKNSKVFNCKKAKNSSEKSKSKNYFKKS